MLQQSFKDYLVNKCIVLLILLKLHLLMKLGVYMRYFLNLYVTTSNLSSK